MSRLLKASCLLADIAWNEHTSSRNIIASEKILLLPTNSLTHRERAWLAKTLFHRYNRPIELVKFPFKFKAILSIEDNYTSLIVGLSLRFAMAASAGLPDILNDLKKELLSQDGDEVEIIRAIIISRGLSEYFVCFDSFGQIRSYSSKNPR